MQTVRKRHTFLNWIVLASLLLASMPAVLAAKDKDKDKDKKSNVTAPPRTNSSSPSAPSSRGTPSTRGFDRGSGGLPSTSGGGSPQQPAFRSGGQPSSIPKTNVPKTNNPPSSRSFNSTDRFRSGGDPSAATPFRSKVTDSTKPSDAPRQASSGNSAAASEIQKRLEDARKARAGNLSGKPPGSTGTPNNTNIPNTGGVPKTSGATPGIVGGGSTRFPSGVGKPNGRVPGNAGVPNTGVPNTGVPNTGVPGVGDTRIGGSRFPSSTGGTPGGFKPGTNPGGGTAPKQSGTTPGIVGGDRGSSRFPARTGDKPSGTIPGGGLPGNTAGIPNPGTPNPGAPNPGAPSVGDTKIGGSRFPNNPGSNDPGKVGVTPSFVPGQPDQNGDRGTRFPRNPSDNDAGKTVGKSDPNDNRTGGGRFPQRPDNDNKVGVTPSIIPGQPDQNGDRGPLLGRPDGKPDVKFGDRTPGRDDRGDKVGDDKFGDSKRTRDRDGFDNRPGDFDRGLNRGTAGREPIDYSEKNRRYDPKIKDLSKASWSRRMDSERVDKLAHGKKTEHLHLDKQYELHQHGDVARKMDLHHHLVEHGGWNNRQYRGPVHAHYHDHSFKHRYCGPSWYPQTCSYPRWNVWVNWSWNYNVPVVWDPRPVYCRPVVYQPATAWVYWQQPAWQPLPVATSGTWVDVARPAVNNNDVQVLAVRFVDPGHPESNLGLRYRVWVRNNSPGPISEPFNVIAMGTRGTAVGVDRLEAGVRVPAMEAEQILPLDLRLPLALPNGAEPFEFDTLHVIADSHRELPEAIETNNGAVLNRGDVDPVDPAVFSADAEVVLTGAIVNLAGEGLGPEPGEVILQVGETQLQVEVVGWYDLGVQIKAPPLPLAELTAAELIVVRGDGAASNPLAVQMVTPDSGQSF